MIWPFDVTPAGGPGDFDRKARDAQERREAARDELRHANDGLRLCLSELLVRLRENNSHESA